VIWSVRRGGTNRRAVLWHDGVIVSDAHETALLDPTREVPENGSEREDVEFESDDFSADDSDFDESSEAASDCGGESNGGGRTMEGTPMTDGDPAAATDPAARRDADPDALFDDRARETSAGSTGVSQDDGGVLPATGDGTITKLYWAGLAAAVGAGAFALVRFYAGVVAAIDVCVSAEYHPLLEAAFNFAVLLAAAVTASLLLRRLDAAGS
jgi:LPXTG-motif cell wall-anchored protein